MVEQGKTRQPLLAPGWDQDSHGMRLLRTWIDRPLVDKERIVSGRRLFRFSSTPSLSGRMWPKASKASMTSNAAARFPLEKPLQGPAALGSNPQQCPCYQGHLAEIGHPALDPDCWLDPIPELHALISAAIDPDAQGTITEEANIIGASFDRPGPIPTCSWEQGMDCRNQGQGQARSGINNLKIDYNKEGGGGGGGRRWLPISRVTNSNLSAKVPSPNDSFHQGYPERFRTLWHGRVGQNRECQMLEALDQIQSEYRDRHAASAMRLEKLHRSAPESLAETLATVSMSSSLRGGSRVRPPGCDQTVYR